MSRTKVVSTVRCRFCAPSYTNQHKLLVRMRFKMATLPETNSSLLKMDGWNTSFLCGARPIFRCELLVSGRVSKFWHFQEKAAPINEASPLKPRKLGGFQPHCQRDRGICACGSIDLLLSWFGWYRTRRRDSTGRWQGSICHWICQISALKRFWNSWNFVKLWIFDVFKMNLQCMIWKVPRTSFCWHDGTCMSGPNWMVFAGTVAFSFECINFVIPMYDAHDNKETFTPILALRGKWQGIFLCVRKV